MFFQDQTVVTIRLMTHFWPGPLLYLKYKGCFVLF